MLIDFLKKRTSQHADGQVQNDAQLPSAEEFMRMSGLADADDFDADEVADILNARHARGNGAQPTGASNPSFADTPILPNVQPTQQIDVSTIQQDQAFQSIVSFDQGFFSANETDASEERSDKFNRHTVKIIGISLIAALVLAYGAGVAVFMGRFYPNTIGEQVDLSMKTIEDASKALEANVADYSVTIDGKEFSFVLQGNDIGFTASGDNIASKMHDLENPWFWPFEVFQSHDTTDAFEASFDASKLASILEQALVKHNETARPSQDAKLGYVESTGKIGVVPEQYGTVLNPHAVIIKVSEAVRKANRKVTLENSEVVAPTLLSSDQGLSRAAASVQGLLHADVKLTIGGQQVAQISAKDYVDWLVIGPDYTASIDNDKMNAWISNLVAGFDTVGSTRVYTRPDGKVVTVSGGDYGWESDCAALQEAILEAVHNNATSTIEVPVLRSAQVYAGAGKQDWGFRYVDIDISEQYVRFYDGDAIIWESDCITGAGYNSERMSPEGVYYVKQKNTNVPLYPFENGKQVKEPTYVTYWMPFVGNMIGLHDAWWQPYFGGTAYLDGLGSHGCINLPPYKAQELFGIIEVGDVVITHY